MQTMQERGVRSARVADIWDETWQDSYDTLLLLMNGTGLAGRYMSFPAFLQRLKRLLTLQGKILIDGRDLRFIFEDESGNIELYEGQAYYGEIGFRLEYGILIGSSFSWLYLDYSSLATFAAQTGLLPSLVLQGEQQDYLAMLLHNSFCIL